MPIRHRRRAWRRIACRPPDAGNGTMPNNEPRKIKTFSVRGDQPDGAAVPVATAPAQPPQPPSRLRPGPPQRRATRRRPPMPTPRANAPLSLSPQAAQSRPSRCRTCRGPGSGGDQYAGADRAQSAGGSRAAAIWCRSLRRRTRPTPRRPTGSLQGKFPSVLGSRRAVDQARRSRRQRASITAPWWVRSVRPMRPRSSAAA